MYLRFARLKRNSLDESNSHKMAASFWLARKLIAKQGRYPIQQAVSCTNVLFTLCHFVKVQRMAGRWHRQSARLRNLTAATIWNVYCLSGGRAISFRIPLSSLISEIASADTF